MIAALDALTPETLPLLLEQFDAREILHVTFGSVLAARTENGQWRFYDRIMELLRSHAELYAENLESHFLRHIRPFVIVQAETSVGG